MNKFSLLEKYGQINDKNSNYLDSVAVEFKEKIVEHIKVNFMQGNVTDDKSIERLVKKFNNLVSVEYNTVTVPYFYILENLNLCVEVEMSNNVTEFEKNQKFLEKKFSDILQNGIESPTPIKRSAISEKKLLDSLESLIESYTQNYEITGDSIKIEFL